MLQRVILTAVFVVTLVGAGVAAAPTAQCQGNCPQYNSPCVSDIACRPLQCGMTCTKIDGQFRKRCR